jgi:hypothetical protein
MRRRTVPSALVLLAFSFACAPTGPGTSNPPGDGGTGSNRFCTIDGVELRKPIEHARTQGGGKPDLSCVDNPQQLTGSRNVTVQGCVEIFGLGGKAKPGLRIAFFDANQDPSKDAPAYGEADIVTKAGGSPEAANCPKEGWYTIDGVPTNKRLIIKVYEDLGPSQTAIPTYTYFKHFPDEDVVDGVYEYEANLIYATTYSTIPSLSGRHVDGANIIYDGKGELVQGASVSSSLWDSSTGVAYFNGDDEDPKPDPAMLSTNFDALYVLLNVNTAADNNDHEVVAAILDPDCDAEDLEECDCVKAGGATVRAFPDSVTLLSPDGTQPLPAP